MKLVYSTMNYLTRLSVV